MLFSYSFYLFGVAIHLSTSQINAVNIEIVQVNLLTICLHLASNRILNRVPWVTLFMFSCLWFAISVCNSSSYSTHDCSSVLRYPSTVCPLFVHPTLSLCICFSAYLGWPPSWPPRAYNVCVSVISYLTGEVRTIITALTTCNLVCQSCPP